MAPLSPEGCERVSGVGWGGVACFGSVLRDAHPCLRGRGGAAWQRALAALSGGRDTRCTVRLAGVDGVQVTLLLAKLEAKLSGFEGHVDVPLLIRWHPR